MSQLRVEQSYNYRGVREVNISQRTYNITTYKHNVSPKSMGYIFYIDMLHSVHLIHTFLIWISNHIPSKAWDKLLIHKSKSKSKNILFLVGTL